MEDLVGGEEKKPVLSIVVKLPFDLQERVLAFPFLHILHGEYPEAEFHLITPTKDIEVLNLLPFKAYYHEFDEDEIKTVLDVHRFAVNAKIYKADIFFSLTNSFADACLGLALRAKKRVGFSDDWKTLVLNEKVVRPRGHHICEDYFSLMEVHLGREIDRRLKVMSRELSPVIEDWNLFPYIAINLSPITQACINQDWIDFVSGFENHRFVFFASEDQDKVRLLIDGFLPKLSVKNLYVTYLFKNWIELAKMMAYSKGVITYNGPAASIASYSGAKTIVLYDREDPKRHGPFYFLSDVLMITPEQKQAQGPVIPSSTFDINQVIDKAHEFFKR